MSSITIPRNYEEDLIEASNEYTEGAKAISAAAQSSIQYSQLIEELQDDSYEIYKTLKNIETKLDENSNTILSASLTINAISTILIEHMAEILDGSITQQIFKNLQEHSVDILKSLSEDELKKLEKILGKSVTELSQNDIGKLLFQSDGVDILLKLVQDESKTIVESLTKQAIEEFLDKEIKGLFISYGISSVTDIVFGADFTSITKQLGKYVVGKATNLFKSTAKGAATEVVSELMEETFSTILLKNSISIFGTIGVNIFNQSIKEEGLSNLSDADFQKIIGEALVGMVGSKTVELFCGSAIAFLGIPVASLVAIPVSMLGSYAVDEIVNGLNYINDKIPRKFEDFSQEDIDEYKEMYGIETENVIFDSFGNENEYVVCADMRNKGYSEEIINIACLAEGDSSVCRYMVESTGEDYPPIAITPEARATLDFIVNEEYSEITDQNIKMYLKEVYMYNDDQINKYADCMKELKQTYSNNDPIITKLRSDASNIENSVYKEMADLTQEVCENNQNV